ncbi:hypothetical protein AUR64_01815 [Haloprofundus marisrubri]|uniref:Sjogrens syndrome scleroderma autoantigen 1 n=1 Tax=Haloprofundus marisrubri TaxID=1514971 RepID=A0A0W1R3Q9_9EURY|nr:Sjogren's syndrome/scleroderma autoantigen 1 family protein [Haloprofundus marisrubri]KTG07993.1 hypothetical protein AUR64_01815 [Haloprofundus marisrubri]
MSEFDKEAEREKLREKFARDEEKRKSTQRMSELLLKGATMTNKHCDTCGDPIFRYQGQEFCPTCQNAQVSQGAQSSQNAQSAESAEATRAQNAAGESEMAQSPETDNEGGDIEVTPEPPQSNEASQSNEQPPAQQTPTSEREETTVVDQSVSTATTARPQSTSGDLSEARAALTRTVTRYATAAEDADDPRRAKELLSAAREAAETLSALNR